MTTAPTTTVSAQRTSTLARLLATENLRIVHDANMPTAAFDMKSRTLILPVWRVAKHVYDMLAAHEVAHAKWSDGSKWEAAKNRIGKTDNQKKVIHDFINVVEDARIDRLMKREYPGLRGDYMAAWKTLHGEMDLLRVKNREVTLEDRFIDRINLHYKVGIHAGVRVPFTNDERAILDRINALGDSEKDFDKVIAIAEELYEREKAESQDQKEGEDEQQGKQGKDGKESKSKSKSKKNSEKSEKSQKSEQGDEGEGEDEGEEQGDEGEGEGQDGDQDGSEGDEGEGEYEAQADGSDGSEGDQDGEGQDGEGEEQEASDAKDGKERDGEYEPEMVQSSSAMSSAMGRFVDRSVVEQQIDVKPIDPSKVVVEASQFIELFDGSLMVDGRARTPIAQAWLAASNSPCGRKAHIDAQAFKAFKRISEENRKGIDAMCRRFEQSRAARNHARTGSQKSGRISTRLLNKYKFSEDIFDRLTIKPDEKNHGLVIMLDWSGSMGCIVRDAVSQLVALVVFCRRVGIPVEVYFFTTSYSKVCTDHVMSMNPNISRKEAIRSVTENCSSGYASPSHIRGCSRNELQNSFTDTVCGLPAGTSALDKTAKYYPFSLVKVHDSTSGVKNTAKTLGRLIMLSDLVVGYGYGGKEEASGMILETNSPVSLGGTPLDESILAMRDIVKNFRKSSNTKVSLIVLTDGEGSSIVNRISSPNVQYGQRVARVVVDATTGRRYETATNTTEIHEHVVQMFKDGTDARIVGIYMTRGAVDRKGLLDPSRIRPFSQSMYANPGFIDPVENWKRSKAGDAFLEQSAKDFTRDNFLNIDFKPYDGYFVVNIIDRSREEEKVKSEYARADATDSVRTRRTAATKAFMAAMRANAANRVFINCLMDTIAK